jgi:hypothetical protein
LLTKSCHIQAFKNTLFASSASPLFKCELQRTDNPTTAGYLFKRERQGPRIQQYRAGNLLIEWSLPTRKAEEREGINPYLTVATDISSSPFSNISV